jgi:hypothetical protein
VAYHCWHEHEGVELNIDVALSGEDLALKFGPSVDPTELMVFVNRKQAARLRDKLTAHLEALGREPRVIATTTVETIPAVPIAEPREHPPFNPLDFEDERTALALAPLVKVGIAVECAVCRRSKKPIGRSAPMTMANSLCNHDCPGYNAEPFPGSLWPGETEKQFDFEVGPYGWKEVAIAEPETATDTAGEAGSGCMACGGSGCPACEPF